MSPALLGVVLGAVGGIGLVMVLFGVPVLSRRRSLGDRIAPYVVDVVSRSDLLTAPPTVRGSVGQLLAPVRGDLARRLDALVGGSQSVRRRLGAVGVERTVEEFRMEQVLWGAVGAGLGLAVGGLGAVVGQATVWGILFLVPAFAVTGVLARDYVLSREANRADAQILAEFPVIADMLALAVTAGEGPLGAIDRITRLARGHLVDQLGALLAETRSGTPLLLALNGLRDRTRLVPFARFLDGMAVAVERGTPLAEVLRAQAADVRELGKRQLMEAGGRKEIAMMVPVVFLILPITVVFAVFPGLITFTTIAR